MISAIILAAGKGKRMNNAVRKQYLHIAGQPVLTHTLNAIDACKSIDKIFLVVPMEDFEFCKDNIISNCKLSKKVRLIPGGTKRQESVYNGIKAASDKSRIIIIHDGVRPFVLHEQIDACIAGAEEFGACILGIPVYDTLKKSNGSWISKTLTRKNVWLAQTPQVFQAPIIKKAYENAMRHNLAGTDDASLVEILGHKVKILNGSKYNIKITNKEDLKLAEAIIASGYLCR